MLIGELAAASGLSREALRFTGSGASSGAAPGQRLPRLSARGSGAGAIHPHRAAVGFTLAETGDRLPRHLICAGPAHAIAAVLGPKLQEIDARIGALQALRTTLAERVLSAFPRMAAPARI